jgi:hypothetical protein
VGADRPPEPALDLTPLWRKYFPHRSRSEMMALIGQHTLCVVLNDEWLHSYPRIVEATRDAVRRHKRIAFLLAAEAEQRVEVEVLRLLAPDALIFPFGERSEDALAQLYRWLEQIMLTLSLHEPPPKPRAPRRPRKKAAPAPEA